MVKWTKSSLEQVGALTEDAEDFSSVEWTAGSRGMGFYHQLPKQKCNFSLTATAELESKQTIKMSIPKKKIIFTSRIYLPLLRSVESQRPICVRWKAWDRSIDWKRLRGFKSTIPSGQVLIHQSAEPEQGATELSRHSDSACTCLAQKRLLSAGTAKGILLTELLGKDLCLFLATFGVSAELLPLLQARFPWWL